MDGIERTAAGTAPVIGVVIPLYKHSVLVGDALASVIAQQSTHPVVAVVVNDGCPFSDSQIQVEALRALRPDLIRTIYRRNGGLSAARNSGIEFLLRTYPSIQAIFFLDSDNRLRSNSLQSAYTTLCDHDEASWVYPNIDMFALRMHSDYSGAYSVLRHAFDNICEAGSLVHRRIFDAGVRFDEQMTLGYEDWDFWLTAASRGFRGVHDPNFGFLYRNRPASMLWQSRRDSDAILAYMRRKHPSILSPRALLQLEADDAPRHAVVVLDTNEVFIGSGVGSQSRTISAAEFGEMIWRTIVTPSSEHVPPIISFTTSDVCDRLSGDGVARMVAYDSEIVLLKNNFAVYELEDATGNEIAIDTGGRVEACGLIALNLKLLMSIFVDESTVWVERLSKGASNMRVVSKRLILPGKDCAASTADPSMADEFLRCIRMWRSAGYKEAARHRWAWREYSVPPSHQLFTEVRQNFGNAVVCTKPPGTALNIGFVLPVACFGGVERVAYSVARQLSLAGAAVHLFLIGSSRAELPEEFTEAFASISFIDGTNFGGWDDRKQFQGTALPSVAQMPVAANRIVAALAWMDVVINHHAGDFNVAAAALRRIGVKTATYLHLLDSTSSGRAKGHPLLGLAYEHAYDRFICISDRLLSWMHGSGVPEDKLLLVRNGPGHALSSAQQARVLEARLARDHVRLRVLFLGRLDRQKGLDRLANVIDHSLAADLPLDWRVVGSAVVDAAPLPPVIDDIVEPPVYDAEALVDLFGWADIMILLSDYEGVPLVILEAQRLGVVVIATDVGAVSEVIESGRNGFLVEPKSAVAQTVKLLRLLLDDDGLRARIAAQASDVPDWPETTAGLVSWLGLSAPQRAN